VLNSPLLTFGRSLKSGTDETRHAGPPYGPDPRPGRGW
jgi:hypothetical protein